MRGVLLPLLLTAAMPASLPVYYINLDRSTDRNESVHRLFGSNPRADLRRVPAVDGRDPAALAAVLALGDDTTREWAAARGPEVALTASHLRAVQLAFEAGVKFAVFLEDDGNPLMTPQWAERLLRLRRRMLAVYAAPTFELSLAEPDPPPQCVRLMYNAAGADWFVFMDPILLKGNRDWIRVAQPRQTYGTVAYALTRGGMKYYLENVSNAEGRLVCPADCTADGIQNEVFKRRTVFPVPAMASSRFFEGSLGLHGQEENLNPNFYIHLNVPMGLCWQNAFFLEQRLNGSIPGHRMYVVGPDDIPHLSTLDLPCPVFPAPPT